MVKFLSLFLVIATLSACSLYTDPHRTRISGGGMTLQTGEGGGNYEGGGKFCPPGQAKKGRC
jgi:hypothetical protein